MNVPIGTIILWGDEAIPGGWQICDGNNGTPNLIDKFIMGCANDDEILDTGGAVSHSHEFNSSSTGSNGAHDHTVNFSLDPTTQTKHGKAGTGSTFVSDPNHPHTVSGSSASGGAHTHSVGTINSADNLPPYIKLIYIMRIA